MGTNGPAAVLTVDHPPCAVQVVNDVLSGCDSLDTKQQCIAAILRATPQVRGCRAANCSGACCIVCWAGGTCSILHPSTVSASRNLSYCLPHECCSQGSCSSRRPAPASVWLVARCLLQNMCLTHLLHTHASRLVSLGTVAAVTGRPIPGHAAVLAGRAAARAQRCQCACAAEDPGAAGPAA